VRENAAAIVSSHTPLDDREGRVGGRGPCGVHGMQFQGVVMKTLFRSLLGGVRLDFCNRSSVASALGQVTSILPICAKSLFKITRLKRVKPSETFRVSIELILVFSIVITNVVRHIKMFQSNFGSYFKVQFSG
jgi:hypothetical protein